jgi:hypothetical protein
MPATAIAIPPAKTGSQATAGMKASTGPPTQERMQGRLQNKRNQHTQHAGRPAIQQGEWETTNNREDRSRAEHHL